MRARIAFGILIIALPSLTLPSTASAQQDVVHVQEWECTSPCGSECTPSALPIDDRNSGDPITIQVNACTRRINIWTDDEDQWDIGRLTIELETGASAPTSLQLFIGEGAFPLTMQPTTAVARDFGGTTILNSTLRAATRFAGHITGDQDGGIEVGRLYLWEVDGNMAAGINAVESPAADQLFRVIAGSMSGGTIEAFAGDITLVQVTGTISGGYIKAANVVTEVIAGELLMDVFAGDAIEVIDVSGAIGSANTAVDILTLGTGATIDFIEAASINANIRAEAMTTTSDPTGDIQRIRTTSSYLKGDVHAVDLGTDPNAPALDVAGDLDANITVLGSVLRPIEVDGALVSTRTLRIDSILDQNGDITLAAGGLDGLIIINAGGSESPAWAGDVKVGTTVDLSPKPFYDEDPSSFGGGSVGVVPFNFHAWASQPEHEEVLDNPPASVTVDHYGPVINTATPCSPTCPAPLKVEHRPLGSSGSWTDQTVQMQFTVESSAPFRHITITPTGGNAFLSDKEYRIQPQYMSGSSGPTRLKCRYGVSPYEESVYFYDYRFSVLPAGSFGGPP